jgi:hypothetical protein
MHAPIVFASTGGSPRPLGVRRCSPPQPELGWPAAQRTDIPILAGAAS